MPVTSASSTTESTSVFGSFLTSVTETFFTTVHGDDEEEEAPEEEEEEEEEEEPEDTAPAIRETCENSYACKPFKHHLEECATRLEAGKTIIEGETCVEEFFHLMHCVNDCAAPKVFATLK